MAREGRSIWHFLRAGSAVALNSRPVICLHDAWRWRPDMDCVAWLDSISLAPPRNALANVVSQVAASFVASSCCKRKLYLVKQYRKDINALRVRK